MLAQPSPGCYFLLAVIFFSGLQAQEFDEQEYYELGDEEGLDATDPPLPTCHAEICVRKCCPVGEVYQIDIVDFKYGCFPKFENESAFEPQFSHKDGRPQEVQLSQVEYLIGFPSELKQSDCPADGMVDISRHAALLLEDGSLYTPESENKRLSIHQYCMDQHRYVGFEEKDGQLIVETHTCVVIYVESNRKLYRFYTHNVCFLISNIALAVLFFLHLICPKMRDVAGCVLLSYAGGLFVGNLGLLLSNQGLHTGVAGETAHSCRAFAFMAHAGYLSSFFWLTAMCYHIWNYVRSTVKGIQGRSLGYSDMKMYVIYSAVVWGILLGIELFVLIAELLPASSLPENFVKPHMSLERCFVIDEDLNLFLYWYMFLCISFSLDIFFIISTGYYLKQSGANIFFCCSKNPASDSKPAVFNAKYLDLFWQRFMIFSMAIFLWTTEVLSWKIPPAWLWEPTDLLNTLQGVIVLGIFLSQKSKRNEISAVFRKWTNKDVKKSQPASIASTNASQMED